MPEFTYMGTKKELASSIASVAARLNPGPFFDLFSGISAAGNRVSAHRQIWSNDAQQFSSLLTEALYRSAFARKNKEATRNIVLALADSHFDALCRELAEYVEEEHASIFFGDREAQIELQPRLIRELESKRDRLRQKGFYCMFATGYAGSYLGLLQSAQLDSIRYGVDRALTEGRISPEEHRWGVLALCRSLTALSNSTGHFAQYLCASPSNIGRVIAKRRRCGWEYWNEAILSMAPIGTVKWRRSNRVFNGDANAVLRFVIESKQKPAVIYADPPYTNDQYSRYYHLLDTAVLYDYPERIGKGQYRAGRFTSNFSLKSKVASEFESLIHLSSKASSSIIISYPGNGLLSNPLSEIPRLLKQNFRYVWKPMVIPYQHSTLGASKGRQREQVEECIFVARS